MFPIDVDSRNPDGAVGRQVIESRLGPGTGGVVHGRQVSSLTSNFNVANPNTRQNQATFFETGPAPTTTTTTTTTTTPKPVNIDLSIDIPVVKFCSFDFMRRSFLLFFFHSLSLVLH